MEFIVFLFLLFLGFVFGKLNERRHYVSIRKREAAMHERPAVTIQRVLGDKGIRDRRLATGSVVVSIDYMKRFLASLRNIFGGEIGSYATLIDRARREAVLRMKESCPDADLYINTRLETSSIYKGTRDSVGSVEVLAYSTAINFADEDLDETA